ncbi:MAG: glycosyltransferase [Hyphomicrobiales bacterium]
MQPSSPKLLKIAVSLITTGNRSNLLKAVVSIQALEVPDNTELFICIIDNSLDGVVQESNFFETLDPSPISIKCFHEPQKGIPFARNKAIKMALELEADLLCFIDDDEFVAADWLKEIVSTWQTYQADLVGGPLFVADAVEGATSWQKFINKSLQQRAVRKMRRTAEAAKRGKKYTIVTNNWLCDLRWQKQNQVWFDEALKYTGGSDTLFFKEAQKVGCEIAWNENAIVYEVQDVNRLSLRYQFFRAASQSLNHYNMKHLEPGLFRIATTLGIALLKFLSGILLFIFPIYGIASLTISIRAMGWSYGRIQGLMGRISNLYDRS